MAELRLFGVVRESIVDGPGLRFVVFTQGCPHGCPGCHNPESHDPLGGYVADSDALLAEFKKNPLLQGMTLSGGEPIVQAELLLPLAQAVVELGKNIVLFTGYTFEELMELWPIRPAVLELLRCCTLLIDGRYMQAERDLTLTFRGSKNQRVLHVPDSLERGCAVTHPYYI